MWTTSNFLGCFKLETGGIVIGWFSFITNFLGLFVSTIAVLTLTFASCDYLADLSQRMQSQSEALENCNNLKTAFIVGLVFYALIMAGFTYIAYICVKGVEERNANRLRPMMIVLAVLTVITFLPILSFKIVAIVSSLFYVLYYGYSLFILYSLYVSFKRENLGGRTAIYQMANTGKV